MAACVGERGARRVELRVIRGVRWRGAPGSQVVPAVFRDAEADQALPVIRRRVIRSRGRGVPGSQGSWPPGRRGRASSSRDRRVIRSRGRGVPGSQGSWPPGRRGRARSSHHRLAAGGVCVRCACVVRGCLLRCAIVVKRCRASRGPPESCFVACGSSHISATGSTAATQPPAFWSWRTSSSKVSVNRSICVHSQSPTGV